MTEGDLLWFKTTELERIPAVPGLYAWYAVPVIGQPDWQTDFDDEGRDQGGQNFSSLLAKHTRRLRTPEMSIDAKGHLWSSWTGSLTETGTQRLAELLDRLAPLEEPQTAKDLHWTMQNSSARQLLATVLLDASPQLSAPVYIGVATNLRRRLSQHIDTLAKARDTINSGARLGDPLRGTFGGRAAEAGLGVDDLRIAVLPVLAFAELSTPDLRRIAAAAEFVLNRWHHPLFGER